MACQRKTLWLALWMVACVAGLPQANAQPPTNWNSGSPSASGRSPQGYRVAARQATLSGDLSNGLGEGALMSPPLGGALSGPSDSMPGEAMPSDSLLGEDTDIVVKPPRKAPSQEILDSELTPVPESAWDAGDGGLFEPPAPLCSSGSLINRGCYYTQLDFMYLNRAGPEGFTLGAEVSMAGNVLLNILPLRTPDALGFQPGARATLGRFLGRDDKNRDYSIEATYMGGFDFYNERALQAIRSQNSIVSVFPGADNGFDFAQTQRFTYGSDLNSAEVNFRVSRRLGRDKMELNPVTGDWVRKSAQGPLPSVIFGLRSIGVEEGFGYFSQGSANTAAANTPPTIVNVSGNYQVKTRNLLIGPQIGTDVYWQTALWKFGARVKGGGLVNFADQHSDVSGVNAVSLNPAGVPFSRQSQKSTNVLAFVGEVNVTGAYYLRPNVAIRASLDLMWINQVALAPEQINFTDPLPTIVHGGDLFYNGGSLGLDIVW